eukprot:GHUV01035122.1.p1 GENE.GHUV01035122.1~~GHUV01035122.1.p1  ORF type:complete len:148 (+),score=32.28 GHUV01035122.1:1210-1653(+)
MAWWHNMRNRVAALASVAHGASWQHKGLIWLLAALLSTHRTHHTALAASKRQSRQHNPNITCCPIERLEHELFVAANPHPAQRPNELCSLLLCSGEENISVIVAPIYEGFYLASLGTPEAAAQNFLDTIVAPAGSDKTANLKQAQQR